LKVKMNGVALISSTIEPAPEQCTVPAGMRKWSCLRRGTTLTCCSPGRRAAVLRRPQVREHPVRVDVLAQPEVDLRARLGVEQVVDSSCV
jgi:hypothetical protein